MSITGTIINYYQHCKRQCWLFYHRINMEDNSEEVRMGWVLHEIKNTDTTDEIDGIKVDKITNEYVIEIKKSDADIPASLDQLKYYLYILYKKGIIRHGKLECIEKNKQTKTVHIIDLPEEELIEMESKIEEIERFLTLEAPPEPTLDKKCLKCAYYEYCAI